METEEFVVAWAERWKLLGRLGEFEQVSVQPIPPYAVGADGVIRTEMVRVIVTYLER